VEPLAIVGYTVDGLRVGDLVGEPEGVSVGDLVGTLEGVKVGMSVGEIVGHADLDSLQCADKVPNRDTLGLTHKVAHSEPINSIPDNCQGLHPDRCSEHGIPINVPDLCSNSDTVR
jgi:hypothetical protein